MARSGDNIFCPRCGAILILKRHGNRIDKYCSCCNKYSHELNISGTMANAQDIGNYNLFPYNTIRPGQKEFMADISMAIENSRHLIAQAPTGIGKTAAAISVSLEYGLRTGLFVMFLTSKQSHHNIAIDTLRLISERKGIGIKVVDIISKKDMCPRPENRMPFFVFNEFCKGQIKRHLCPFYENDNSYVIGKMNRTIMSVNDLIDICIEHGVCPHKTALEFATYADIMICDYNYIFSPQSENILQRIKRELGEIILIVDEAHNLPERVTSHMSSILTVGKVDEAAKELRTDYPKLYRYLLSISASLTDMIGRMNPGEERYMTKDELINTIESIISTGLYGNMTLEEFIDNLVSAGENIIEGGGGYSYASDMADFLEKWCMDMDAMCRIMSRVNADRIILKLLDPSITTTNIFRNVHSAILMSATLYPMEMYRDLLGLDADRTDLKDYPSPFPKDNRAVMTTHGITTRYTSRGKLMYKQIASIIKDIAMAVDGNTAVFFPSYAILDEVAYIISGYDIPKRILIEERGMSKMERDMIINRIYKYRSPGVILMGVLGGSFSEGVDYTDNVLSVVVIVGIPFAPPELENRAVREYYVNKFGKDKGDLYGYIYPAFKRVIQAAGRLIRSENDRGVIVLLDDRFTQRYYMRFLPPSLRPVIVDHGALKKSIANFFRREGNEN